MKSFKAILIAIGAVLFPGCATSYQSSGLTGGYNETQLAPDVFRVVFRGNGYTRSERAQDFSLLRASELALQHGFTHLAIIDESNTTTAHSFTTAGQATTTGNVYFYRNQATYSSTTTYTPGETHTFYKPKTGLMVQCFKTKPDGVFVFDAAFLQQSIKQTYKIK